MSAGHLLTDSITYSPVTDRTSGGQPVYGSQVTIAARVEERSVKITDDEGVERVGSHVVVTEIEIPKSARVWLPDDDTTQTTRGRRVIGRRKARIPQTGYELHETVF
jgi:hypothetical protein